MTTINRMQKSWDSSPKTWFRLSMFSACQVIFSSQNRWFFSIHFRSLLKHVHLLSFLCQSAWATITSEHRLGGLNHRNVFLTVLEAGRLRSRCWQGRCPSFWGPSLGVQVATILPYAHMTSEKASPLLSLLRTLIPWDQGSSLMTSFNLYYLLIGPNRQVQSQWVLGLQQMNVGGDTPFSPKACVTHVPPSLMSRSIQVYFKEEADER